MKNIKYFLLALLLASGISGFAQKGKKPNIVLIFCDDLGYGDLGVYGHPTIATPNLDRLAFEGQKWTSFYASAPVCTPSRAGLVTGRLAVRSGMASENRRVLFPDSGGGLPQEEISIARQLKKGGYATGIIGKWHLGHLPEHTPIAHGFDYYFGIPYSNDMDRIKDGEYFSTVKEAEPEYFNVPLIRNTEEIERPANQRTITKRYTEEAVKFIENHKKEPFFLYLAHSMPHVPLFPSEEFEGKSSRGVYGDVVEEIDWSVGEVIRSLKKNRLDENTLVIFTSDNGPWLIFEEQGGSAGLLKGGKGGTYEGGMREPAIFWWPGKIQPSVVQGQGSTLDFFPTFSALAGIALPDDRLYDGFDISGALFGKGKSPRDVTFYYRDEEVYAVRKGDYKVHFITREAYARNKDKTIHNPPLLFNISHDPSERVNVAAKHPELIAEFESLLEKHKRTVKPVENQLEK
ncbi:C-terminal region of aryl-sulfatase [Sinomicrobium oceani]|uniref:C-terminal region of aryl-sulfatase n=1 Tax=Sinomicrobium oceani TaxID=1150368 RepID=A0A1K1QGK6_9FLAO|nr:sulfatase [Sinomicrobium oceani]SFW59088.1 C-terminal region of aryl-sulfatase [Sinomicrobium oceani]